MQLSKYEFSSIGCDMAWQSAVIYVIHPTLVVILLHSIGRVSFDESFKFSFALRNKIWDYSTITPSFLWMYGLRVCDCVCRKTEQMTNFESRNPLVPNAFSVAQLKENENIPTNTTTTTTTTTTNTKKEEYHRNELHKTEANSEQVMAPKKLYLKNALSVQNEQMNKNRNDRIT